MRDRGRRVRRDEDGFSLIAWTALVVGGTMVLLGLAGGIAYATDYGVEATIVGKDCPAGFFGSGLGEVTVETKLFGIERTVGLPKEQCLALNEGNFAVYHLRTARTTLYETEGGPCIYDSEKGVGC